jgi:hypothetical protein
MRNGVVRIVIWASVGFIVAVGWGVYFTNANKAEPIGPIISTLSLLTVPLVGVAGSYGIPIGLRPAILANAATYALIGLIVAIIRRNSRPPQLSN